jgi:light-regulated signal transduction histidine kinase (bacteriophytochrome)
LTKEVCAKSTALASRNWSCTTAAGGKIVADRQRLTQAWMQLAHNAARHTGPDHEIEVGSTVADGVARLWVRDTGAGIPSKITSASSSASREDRRRSVSKVRGWACRSSKPSRKRITAA